MTAAVVKKMCERVQQCRRLAGSISDPRAAAILRQMADEGEADIKRLEAAQAGGREG